MFIKLLMLIIEILGFMPASLPASCLTMAPRLDMLESFNRKPLTEMNNSLKIEEVGRVQASPRKVKPLNPNQTQRADHDIDNMLKSLEEQLSLLLKAKPGRDMASSGETNFHFLLKTSNCCIY